MTGIRGAAAIWVLAFHIGAVSGLPTQDAHGVARIIMSGWLGVDLFFLLSGFILMHAHARDFAGSPRAMAFAFYRARFWRVYPLNAVVLLLIAAVAVADPVFADFYRARAPGNLSAAAFVKTLTLSTRWLLPGKGEWNEPVWSLSVEVVGYVAFPVLAYGISAARRPSLLVGLIAACFGSYVVYLTLRHGFGQNAINGVAPLVRMATEFTAGVALYRLRQVMPALSVQTVGRLGAAAILATLVLAVAPYGVVAAPIAFAALILSLSYRSGIADRLLSQPVMLAAGRLSFPLYLLHLTALWWLAAHWRGSPLARTIPFAVPALAVAAVAIAVAALLHRWVEKPMSVRAQQVLSSARGGR